MTITNIWEGRDQALDKTARVSDDDGEVVFDTDADPGAISFALTKQDAIVMARAILKFYGSANA
jgi:hypothetical protein